MKEYMLPKEDLERALNNLPYFLDPKSSEQYKVIIKEAVLKVRQYNLYYKTPKAKANFLFTIRSCELIICNFIADYCKQEGLDPTCVDRLEVLEDGKEVRL